MRRLEMLCCARTTTRIGRHDEKKHKEQDPEMRRQTSPSLLVRCLVCFYIRIYIPVSICVYTSVLMNACLTDSCVLSPLRIDAMSC